MASTDYCNPSSKSYLCQPMKKCRTDKDCVNGAYCTSQNVCLVYDDWYCNNHLCGLGDGGKCVLDYFAQCALHVDIVLCVDASKHLRFMCPRLQRLWCVCFLTDCDSNDEKGCTTGLICNTDACNEFHPNRLPTRARCCGEGLPVCLLRYNCL